MKMKSGIMVIVLLGMVYVTGIFAEDWPQYLGPGRNGISAQKDILITTFRRPSTGEQF